MTTSTEQKNNHLSRIPGFLLEPVRAADPIAHAAKKIIASQLHIVFERESKALHGDDPEDLHEMRVAVRRLRTALRVFHERFEPERLARFEDGLKQTGAALGEVRDLDSFLIWLNKYRNKVSKKAAPALEALREEFTRVRDEKIDIAHREVAGDSYQQWTEALLGFLPETEAETPPARVEAPSILIHLLQCVLGETDDVESATFRKLHKLRIRCKWLRYFGEFFDPVYHHGLKEIVDQIKALQSDLGTIQDHSRDIALMEEQFERLSKLASGDGAKSLKALIEHFEASREKARGAFEKRWGQFNQQHNLEAIRKTIRDGVMI